MLVALRRASPTSPRSFCSREVPRFRPLFLPLTSRNADIMRSSNCCWTKRSRWSGLAWLVTRAHCQWTCLEVENLSAMYTLDMVREVPKLEGFDVSCFLMTFLGLFFSGPFSSLHLQEPILSSMLPCFLIPGVVLSNVKISALRAGFSRTTAYAIPSKLCFNLTANAWSIPWLHVRSFPLCKCEFSIQNFGFCLVQISFLTNVSRFASLVIGFRQILVFEINGINRAFGAKYGAG